MNSLYTPEVRNYVFSRPWPKGLVMDIKEYEYHLGFVFYVDNFQQFDGEAQRQIASCVKETMETIRGMGIPCYMEKEARVPHA